MLPFQLTPTLQYTPMLVDTEYGQARPPARMPGAQPRARTTAACTDHGCEEVGCEEVHGPRLSCVHTSKCPCISERLYPTAHEDAYTKYGRRA